MEETNVNAESLENVQNVQKEETDDFAEWQNEEDGIEGEEATEDAREADETDEAEEGTDVEEHHQEKNMLNEYARLARKQAQKTFNELAQKRGFNSMEEFMQWYDTAMEAQLKEAAYDGGEDAIEELANFRAEVKAREVIAKQENEIYAQKEVENLLNGYVADFNAKYPGYNVKDINDIAKLPNAQKIFDIMKGAQMGTVSLGDAFLIANREDIIGGKIKEAQQSVRNNINSKKHLQSTAGNGSGEAVHIPSDVLKEYMAYGFSREDAIADYKKQMKG